jgi:hypothetical protein
MLAIEERMVVSGMLDERGIRKYSIMICGNYLF